MKFQNFVTIT